jgi:ribosomal protein S18 acetylase RimI-like enzyme
MIVNHKIRLATPDDAAQIALMSRDLIEHGLGWGWRPQSIRRCIANPSISVAVAPSEVGVAGFAIMEYKEDEAHLMLLAVGPAHRRRGIARALLDWHEQAALTAGIGTVYIEARANADETRAFYRAVGYSEVTRLPKYYRGVEDAVMLGKDLWATIRPA